VASQSIEIDETKALHNELKLKYLSWDSSRNEFFSKIKIWLWCDIFVIFGNYAIEHIPNILYIQNLRNMTQNPQNNPKMGVLGRFWSKNEYSVFFREVLIIQFWRNLFQIFGNIGIRCGLSVAKAQISDNFAFRRALDETFCICSTTGGSVSKLTLWTEAKL